MTSTVMARWAAPGLQILRLAVPLPAENIGGHARLAAATSVPIAVGESLYLPSHFREYLTRSGAGIVQPDVACIGAITGCAAHPA
jgi:L-alanine-DL-glutamate epimerase-like enolase superfamily enzyme